MVTPIAITCGDPAGIGPETIEAWLATEPAAAAEAVVIGPARWLERLALRPEQKLAVGPADHEAVLGRPEPLGARLAWAAMEAAASGVREGRFAGVVTGPVSKAALAAVGYPYAGQTEFFEAQWGGEPVMAFCGGRLRVVLATWHIPLREVAGAITRDVLRRAAAAAVELVGMDGVTTPRIGVCGLNPHAGEGGLLGSEERDTIDPLLDGLRGEFPGLSRCQPGDTIFGRALRGEYDVTIALYHDQGLGPLKTIDFDQAVNVTLGLPFVRTSPDHGTAFGLAGRGLASPTSFINAVRVARCLINARASR